MVRECRGPAFRLARDGFPHGRPRRSPVGPERSGGPAKWVDGRGRPCGVNALRAKRGPLDFRLRDSSACHRGPRRTRTTWLDLMVGSPSLHRRYPASPVLRASPPPCSARPGPRGLSVGACHATGRASRVASIPLFHTCHRHCPGGTGRCSRRSLPDRWQPSPCFGRVGFRVGSFEACPAFTCVVACVVAEPPEAALVIGVLQPMSLPPSSAPTATGWSDSCRAGFAPAVEWRLLTAHRSPS